MWRVLRGRRDEARIRASLNEKEALLRELQHRVKNNLQVVSSLLDMAGRRLEGAEARQSLEEVRAKVQAMSLAHAQLHGEGKPGGMDLERYVRALFRQLREVYSGGMDLSLSVVLDPLLLGPDQAVPLGLALNEALANVFKHACAPEPVPGPDVSGVLDAGSARAGRVVISAWQEPEGLVSIEVCDNGPGLPAGLDPERADSLGMKLMHGLVQRQLGGELDICNRPVDQGGGVCVRIRFQPKNAT
jgi:two-component sensor histidine kinase